MNNKINIYKNQIIILINTKRIVIKDLKNFNNYMNNKINIYKNQILIIINQKKIIIKDLNKLIKNLLIMI